MDFELYEIVKDSTYEQIKYLILDIKIPRVFIYTFKNGLEFDNITNEEIEEIINNCPYLRKLEDWGI